VTIVVLDDEAPIMQLCVMVLRADGHDVVGFTRAEAALAGLAARPADLLLVDYRMPGLSGLEVARRARAVQPELRIVMITGHATQDVVGAARQVGVDNVLAKPFTPGELAATVAAVLPPEPSSDAPSGATA
jgi:DNA-binding response OmpR family regulator